LRKIVDNSDRKLFLIPAVPSSGTSALAGVLHHLGVYMGNIDREKALQGRGYEMFEDTNAWKWCALQHQVEGEYLGRLSRTAFRLRSYVNHRLLYDPPGPVGAKIPGVMCNYDPDLPSLDVVTLNVHREFEQCVVSDRKTLVRQGKYEAIKDNIDQILAFNRMRAGDLGACVAAKLELFTYHDPIVNLTFTELVEKKEEMVPKIAETLGLEPSDEQLEAAINFLDKDKKHS
jgi:hypothetical protein